MHILIEVLKHYAIEFGTIVIIVILTLVRNLIANILSSLFVRRVVYGEWATRIDTGGRLTPHEDVKLNQFFSFVRGIATTKNARKYRVSGRIKGERLRLIYEALNAGTDGGAILLEIFANGKEMKGFELGIDDETNDIYSKKYEWTKKP
jgi:hypothetical protein